MFAKKIGMTQVFDDMGRLTPVTVLRYLKNTVVGKRKSEKDGYNALIVARIDEKAKTRKSLSGQFKNVANIKKVEEIKMSTEEVEKNEAGQEILIDSFKEGDVLRVQGMSKGKGFAGTVKRHSFNTGPKTHGSNNYRKPGSIGDTAPQRVIKGKKMAGHMGHEMRVIKNVEVLRVEKEKNYIWVKGPIPGPNKSIVTFQK